MLHSVKPSAALVVCLLLPAALGCGGDDPEPASGPSEVSFASDFLWGSATAGFQIESGLENTDWGVWAALEGSGDDPNDGPDALNHIDGDIELMGQAGLVAYRFSVEMARVFPTRQAFDDDAPAAEGLAKYDELVDTAIAMTAPRVVIFADGRRSRNFDVETLAAAHDDIEFFTTDADGAVHGVIDAGSLVLRGYLSQQTVRLAGQTLKTEPRP